MDNPDIPVALAWAPPAALVSVGWALTAVTGVTAVLLDDVRGSLLLGLASVVLAVLSLIGSVARPRLAVDASGVTVRGLTGTRRWTWDEVRLRLACHRRFGREVTAVEIDTVDESVLVVLGRLDLGADPEDVVAAALAVKP